MELGWLVILLTLLTGFVLGKKVHGTMGIIISAALGATVYVLGLFLIAGPSAVFTFDISTQLLMVAFGALTAIFGWFIGENIKLPILRKTKKENKLEI
jgi:hypothetical protein